MKQKLKNDALWCKIAKNLAICIIYEASINLWCDLTTLYYISNIIIITLKVHRRCWVYSQPLCSHWLDSDLHLSGHLFVHSYLHCLHPHSCKILQTQKNTPEKSHPAQQKKEHLCQRHHIHKLKQRYWSDRRLSNQWTFNSR